jgi:hypothetical protein
VLTLLTVGHLSGNLEVDLASLGQLGQPGDLLLHLSISEGTKFVSVNTSTRLERSSYDPAALFAAKLTS